MEYGYCPRCGTKRPDEFKWCRKCGLDFAHPAPPDPPRPQREQPVARQDPRPGQPRRIDVRPIGDRRSIAQWTRDAMEVRCLGTIGGIVGMFIGLVVAGWIISATQNPVFGLVMLIVLIPLGYFLGARFALGLLAR